MGIALQPDIQPDPNDPLKKKAAGVGLAPGAQASTTTLGALPTEYPDAKSTTGAPQNRLQLATTAFDTFAKSTAPQYTADIRQAGQAAAGKGQIGSGGLRTTYGNLANQRSLALDTQRDNLINDATKGTIADQQAAEAQKLAGYNAETGRIGTTGNLKVAEGQLGLAEKAQATSAGQTQQSIDLQKSRDAIDAQVKAGTLTLAQAQQKLNELTAGQQYGLETEKLGLAKTGQEASIGQGQQQIDLAKKTADINAAFQSGQLSLAQKDQALRELSNSQQNTIQTGQLGLAEKSFEAQTAADQQRIQIAKDSLAQTGAQFGLSLAQQKELATLADKTQNRQLDISAAGQAAGESQGKTGLMLELARIMGVKDPSQIPQGLLDSILKSLGGVVPPPATGEVPKVTPTGTIGLAGTGGTGQTDNVVKAA